MKPSAVLTGLTVLVAPLLFVQSQPALSQQACSSGPRTTSGECVSQGLVAGATLRSTLITQQKFSYSARLVPPSLYSAYPRPFDYHEYQFYQQVQPGGPFLYSCHPNC
jgi:hypothetical protein